jgi:hypothetical protein
MTDNTISQAKERLEKANLALINASERLQNFKKFLKESEKDSLIAQEDFDDKTTTYSLAIQKVNQLKTQADVSENELTSANKALELAKLDHQIALIYNENHKYLAQSTFRNVTNAQMRYDRLKVQFDNAKHDYEQLLREQSIITAEKDNPSQNLDFLMAFLDQDASPDDDSPDDSLDDKTDWDELEFDTTKYDDDDTIVDKDIDFLMTFLNHNPEPEEEETIEEIVEENNEDDTQLAIDETTGVEYDTTIPFEKRPAIEKPSQMKQVVPDLEVVPDKPDEPEAKQTGHITWEFTPPPDVPNPNQIKDINWEFSINPHEE